VNGARGEVSALIAGEPRMLCLTLGALAEIETAFGTEGWEALTERLRKLSPADVLSVLAALLRGGGETETAEALGSLAIGFREAAAAVTAAFEAAGG
jgi:hypothetical protein